MKTLLLAALVLTATTALSGELKTLVVSSADFQPMDSNTRVLTDTFTFGRYPVVPIGQSFLSLLAPVNLPEGALVQQIELEYCSGGQPSLTVFLREKCSAGVDCYAPEPYEHISLSGALPGCARTSAETYPPAVENGQKRYYLQAEFGQGNDAQILAVRIRYFLTVRKRPVAPTFSDVPTDSPFFPFVESLVTAGAVAGCGSGKFCAESFITRQEAAVMITAAQGEVVAE